MENNSIPDLDSAAGNKFIKTDNSDYLRVLLMEDNPDDVFLVQEMLSESKEKYQIENFEMLKEGIESFLIQDYDVILLDLGLPDSQGFETFEKMYQIAPDVPILILTGLSNEELAGKAVRGGAQDYLLKIELDPTILSKSIKYAIERKKSEIKLLKEEVRYRNALENMMEGCQIISPEWRYIYLNNAALKHAQVKREDIIGHTMMEVFPGIDKTDMFAVLKKCMEDKKARTLENHFIYPDGTSKWFELSIHSVPEGLFILSMDLTKRKKAEENLKKSIEFNENIINSMQEGYSLLDTNGVHINVNPAFCEMTGYSKEELIGKGTPHPYWPEEDYQDIERNIKRVLEGNLEELELTLKKKNGELFQAILSPAVIKDDDGKVLAAFATFKDITERKNFENALKKSEERFRTVADFTYDWEYWISPDEKLLYVSPSCERISGYSPQDFMADRHLIQKITHSEDKKILENHLHDRTINQEIGEIEFRIITRNGEEKWIDHRCQPIYNEQGDFLGTRATNRDITEIKQSEKIALIWESIFEKSNFGLALIDASTNLFIDVNTAYATQRGYNPEEIVGKHISTIYPPQLREWLKNITKEIDSKNHMTLETVNIRKDGTEFPVLIELTVLRDYKGVPQTRVVYALDITELKKAENELKSSEEKFRELFENANDMISLNLFTDDGLPSNFIEVNKIGLERLGYTKEEFLELTPYDIIAPESRGQIPENAQKLDEKGYAQYEMMHISKNGVIIPVEVNNHIFELEGQKVGLAISRDISERIKSEKRLKESESKYRGLFDSSTNYLIIVSEEGILLDVNEAAADFTGLSKEELIGSHFSELKIMPPEELETHFENISRIFKGEEAPSFESKYIDKDGAVHYVINNFNPLKKDGKVFAFQIICNDITDLKLAENELRESLHEKEVLLQEIHHRVKNNMQIISSLLNLQSYEVQEEETRDILTDSQTRIKAMSMVHEKLYMSSDLSHINLKDYVIKLVQDLFSTYDIRPEFINYKLDLEDLELNMETIIPLGLIINEVVTNSLKFAFPDGKGTVGVSLKTEEDKHVLTLYDNGIGMDEDIKNHKAGTLGLKLVQSLVNQLDAEMKLDCREGTKFIIKFQEMKYQERI